jgi:prepilin-type N-terminal cleavage/methylation domain-containing protein
MLDVRRLPRSSRRIQNQEFRIENRGPCHAVAPRLRGEGGFTLIELLVVISIIAILLVLMAPAFTTLKSGGDVTSAAYTTKGVLDQARTYAMANNTYTWVGFYEEDVSQPSIVHGLDPCTGCVGRLVMSIVASKDGTMIYTAPLTSVVTLTPANLIQVGKPTKIDNVHLKTFAAGSGTAPANTFATRPAVGSTAAQIGDNAPPSPSLRFQYPLASSAQYTFSKAIQFSPRGEAVIDNSNYTSTPVSEIGIQPTHGVTLSLTNNSAIQLTGMSGDVKIYRQ